MYLDRCPNAEPKNPPINPYAAISDRSNKDIVLFDAPTLLKLPTIGTLSFIIIFTNDFNIKNISDTNIIMPTIASFKYFIISGK